MSRKRGLSWRVGLIALALGTGYLVLRDGVAQTASRSPAMLAMALEIAPGDPEIHALEARAQLAQAASLQAAKQQQSLLLGNSEPLQQAARSARRVLEADLTQVDALSIMGLAANARGDHQAANRIMQASATLSKRDVATRLYLIERAARNEQLAEMLRQIDITLRFSPSAQAQMFPLLARALAEPSLVPDFIRILRPEPSWTEPFLYTAITSGHGTRNLARIYLALGKPFKHDGQDLSELIMHTLVAQREYQAAFAFNDGLTGEDAMGARLRDPAFVRHEGLEPFTWVLTATAEFDAVRSTDPFGKTGLSVLSSGSGADVVAAQLLKLRPGRYRFANSVSSDMASISLEPQWRLRCADDDRLLGTFDPIEEKQATWTVPADCNFHWLQLYIDAGSTITGETIFVNAVTLEPLGASSQTGQSR